ncbi:MAG: FAD-dependent oxidoreductase [Candidatus Lokiarchaeota archaeon]|nr:FAD-dependent oxidoreductase [Candidatus Lokiarchaeota archaeon]
MRIIIVGNGIAGIFTAKNLRSLNKEVEIIIYAQEKYSYYSRIKLPELINEKLNIDDLIVFKDDWYKTNNIKTYLNKKIEKIDKENKKLFIEGESQPIAYDKLVLATGSVPNIPPIKNAIEMIGNGVFTLRNIDNALEIREFIKNNNVKKAIVIGGGLLGLELAKQIKDYELDTTVVEFFPRLLPRQLDLDCGGMLKEIIENLGIKVELNAVTEEILLDENKIIKGIKIKDGREIRANIILIQAGIKPTIELANKAKLNTNRGIIVNEFLETSQKDIYAVGDCIEYENHIWGIIPACIDQSKIVGSSILGKKSIKYKGTIPKNTLKIIGIDLTSIGVFDPEDKDLIGAGWEILKNIDEKSNCYKKIILKDNKLKGAILFGEKNAVAYVNKNIEKKIEDNRELRKAINLYEWICQMCGNTYDDAKIDILFRNLPKDWKCVCGAPKDKYKNKNLD